MTSQAWLCRDEGREAVNRKPGVEGPPASRLETWVFPGTRSLSCRLPNLLFTSPSIRSILLQPSPPTALPRSRSPAGTSPSGPWHLPPTFSSSVWLNACQRGPSCQSTSFGFSGSPHFSRLCRLSQAMSLPSPCGPGVSLALLVPVPPGVQSGHGSGNFPDVPSASGTFPPTPSSHRFQQVSFSHRAFSACPRGCSMAPLVV